MYQSNNTFNEQRHRAEVNRRLNAIIVLLVIVCIVLLESRLAHVKEVAAVRSHCDSLHVIDRVRTDSQHAAQENQITNCYNHIVP